MASEKFDCYLEVQGNYGYGWETCTADPDSAKALANLREYRENAPGSYRLKFIREKVS